MLPAHPPLPTASSFPFHPPPAAPPRATDGKPKGSQTSILMSESLDGVSVAATRQNAGRLSYGFAPRPRACTGATNAPAATVCAIVIVVCGSERFERSSQVAALALEAAKRMASAAIFT